ncbi:MipA/OmpV family protein [Paracoccus sp. S-4012]|uniref:MipA/OmpV family protein n=1 Tax=Paracoccus sp. S-4012 TaxID=2665648 RepID=UPI0018A1E516|nr:MipA/OmpV family protein [Paracoccus sp. S-4012]
MPLPRTLAAAFGLALAATLPAAAQEAGGPVLSFDLGLGVNMGPTYPGSDDHEASPWLILRDLSFGADAAPGRPADGFYLSPSFDYLGGRDTGDDPRLRGLDEIDPAVELGLRGGYRFSGVDAYATLRQGFGGHSGIVGEVGARYTTPLTDRLSLTSGLATTYGDDDYMGTYFGVTPGESAASGYDAFDPDGGVKSAIAGFEMRYQATPRTAVLGRLQAERLLGDAADSPLVRDDTQVTVGVGLVRSLSFGF